MFLATAWTQNNKYFILYIYVQVASTGEFVVYVFNNTECEQVEIIAK